MSPRENVVVAFKGLRLAALDLLDALHALPVSDIAVGWYAVTRGELEALVKKTRVAEWAELEQLFRARHAKVPTAPPPPVSMRANNQRGSVLLEAALIIPVFLLLAVGGLEIDFLALARQHVDYIATSAAACGKTAGCDVSSNIYNNATGLNVSPADLNCTQDTGVSCTLTYHPFSPFLPSDMTLTARAQ